MEPQLDTTSGDYADAQATGLENAVYLRLMVPLGSWWRDPLLGSRLHELAREKDTPRVRLLAEQYASTALKSLLDTKQASRIEVNSEAWHDGWLRLAVRVWDAGGHESLFHHPVAVGG
ncbi:phage GP46 family protein [Chitinibacter sp. S2-10]|uniref:phage GP46 family protein n=1 Tax=Chitinibacter sp. S2-10 TaxID=3373597 RepID=UPI00397777CF